MAIIGYARVSTADQTTENQIAPLTAAGCRTVFTENASGADRRRPELAKALKALQSGDTLMVVRIDRLARSASHLLEIIEDLESRGVAFKSLGDPIDTRSSHGRFVLQMLAAVAELERSIIRERTIAGLAVARSKGRVGGNPGLRDRDPETIAKVSAARDAARNAPILANADTFLPIINAMRPGKTWEETAAALNSRAIPHPASRQPWTLHSLARVAVRLVDAGLANAEILDRAPRVRQRAGDPAYLVAGLINMNPTITMAQIAHHLQAMGQTTPRGMPFWSASSIQAQIVQAQTLGLLSLPKEIIKRPRGRPRTNW
jgi:DNA invertase Pin-like site-specific DNA recombinase